ncbi:hypothetical protein [Thermovibrio sp.]
MKKLLGALTLGLIISSCGGGSSTSFNETGKEITATVESSLVKGAEVCVQGTDNCAITDDKGVAKLIVKSLPVVLEVKVAELPLGDVKVNSDVARINPIVLAEGDDKVAAEIANLIHALAGDTTGSQEVVDLSKVQVEANISGSIEEALKKGEKVDLKVKVGEQEHTVVVDPEVEQVEFDGEHCNAVNETKELLWKLGTFLTASNGQEVALLSSTDNKEVDCKLELNPENPMQFKLSNCTNPEYDSVDWNGIEVEDNQVIITINQKSYTLSDVNLDTFTVKLQNGDETLTAWLTGTSTLVPEMSNDEVVNNLEKGKFDLVYSYLSTKPTLTDQEKVELALAVLAKAAKNNLLVPAGYEIISPDEYKFFKVEKSGDTVLELTQEGAKNLLPQIDKAIEVLGQVKDPSSVEIPSDLNSKAKNLDEASLKAMEALLYYAKSNLEYLMAYNWSVYQNDLNNSRPSILQLASKLELTDNANDYLESSRKDLEKSADILYSVGKFLETNPPKDGSLTYTVIKKEDDGFKVGSDFWTNSNYELILDDLEKIASGEDTVDIRLPKQPEDSTTTYDYEFNVNEIFTPITGQDVKADVESGNAIEVNVCTGYVGYYDEENDQWEEKCYRYDRDIWITKDSNIFQKLQSVYPDIGQKLKALSGTYNGKQYYSLTGKEVDPQVADFYVIYPNDNENQ